MQGQRIGFSVVFSRDTHRRFDTSGVRNGRLCQELHLHASAWWADVCQFQFTTLGWLKLVLDNILKTGWSHN